jgi:tetrathionate reductase subunit B
MARSDDPGGRRRFLGYTATAAGTAAVLAALPVVSGDRVLAAAKPGKHRWGFLIDLERCLGCKACSVACKTEFQVPLGVFRSSVKELDVGKFPKVTRHFVPWMCNHCEKPICLRDCPVDEIEAVFTWPDNSTSTYQKRATYRRPDGPVLVDYERCISCGACVDLCPYQVRFLNPGRLNAEGDPVADKCTLCVHRLDAGLVPACVNTCQANARVVGDLNDPDSEIAGRIKGKQVQVLLPEKDTDPQCLFIALHAAAYTEGRDTR